MNLLQPMKLRKEKQVKGKKTFEEATESEIKELAILIETDGSICTYHSNRIYHPQITVTMCGYTPIRQTILLGGNICLHKSKKMKKYMYAWRILARELLRPCLEVIIPYLTEKQQQAKIALKMLKILDTKPKNYKHKLELLAAEITRLNNEELPIVDIQSPDLPAELKKAEEMLKAARKRMIV